MSLKSYFRSTMLLLLVQMQLFSPAAAAILSWLPRFNLQKGTVETGDLGSYDLFDCEGGRSSSDPSSDRSCKLNTDSDGDMMAYVTGTGFYTAIGLFAAIVVIISALGYIIYSIIKLCCCCLCKSDDDKVKERNGVNFWCAGLFFLCLVMILSAFLVSTVNGNLAITENTSNEYSAANSLIGVKNIVHSFEPSATHALLDSTSNVMRPTLLVTNRTLNRAISVQELIHAFKIMEVTIPLLPNAHVVVDILNNTRAIIYNASNYMGLIITNLDDIDVLTQVMLNDTAALSHETTELTEINSALLGIISHLNDTIYDTMEFVDDMVGDSGVVTLSVADLTSMQRVHNGGVLPNTDVFEDASTGATASTARLLAGDLNGNSVEISLMNDKLIAIDKNMSALPDYGVTADRLVTLNDTINDVLAPGGLLQNLTGYLHDLDALVQEPIPVLQNISITITNFQGTLNSLVEEMRSTVAVLRVLLPLIESLLPQFNFLESEVNKMYSSEALLPILDIMVDQFKSINETLFVLTDPFNTAIRNIANVNETLRDFLFNGTLVDILEQLDEAEINAVDALDSADEQSANLDDFLTVLEENIGEYDISEINGTISDAIELLEGISFNDTFAQLATFEAALKGLAINQDFVDSLRALQVSLDQFLLLLDKSVGPTGDYILLAQGHCTGHEDVYCSVDADCSAVSSVCNVASMGTYRCASPIGATACTQDSTCTDVDVTSHCLADGTQAGTLHAVLVSFADDTSDLDVSGVLEDLQEVLANSNVDFSSALKMLDDAVESINTFNSSEVKSMISEVEDGITEVDTASVRDSLSSTQDSIDSVDFQGFIDQINDNMEIYDRVANNTFLSTWVESFEAFKDFMYKDDQLKSYLGELEGAVLESYLTAGGPSSALNHIGAQADRAYEDIRLNQSGIALQRRDEPFATKYADRYDVLDKMGASRYPNSNYASNDQHGALYYLFALADNLTIGNKRTVHAEDPLARGIVANAEGYRYEDPNSSDDDDDGDASSSSVYCFTSACFSYTMNIINTAPMSEVGDEIFPPTYDGSDDGSDSSAFGDYSREEFMTLLWVPVLILLGIGVFSLIFALIPQTEKLHRGCNCCFLSCALLILPFIFIFSSFFVVLAIVGEDSCTSGTAIGETYIKGYGDEYCNDMLKGTGTLEECKFNFTLPESFGENKNITLRLNILDAYNAMFQQECGMATDPFERLALDLAEQIQPLALQASDKALAGSQYELRPALELIVNSTAKNYGQVMYNLIAETNADDGHKVMSCQSMSLLYEGVEDTGCEGVVLPGVWLIASWYFVAWAICCCGVPASCSTLLKYKVQNEDELLSGSERGSEGSEEEGDEEEGSDEEVLETQDVHLGNESDLSDEEVYHDGQSGIQMVQASAPVQYSAVRANGPQDDDNRPGARPMSAPAAAYMKEEHSVSSGSSNTYLDRSRDSARSLGLQVKDSRFQTSRNL